MVSLRFLKFVHWILLVSSVAKRSFQVSSV